MQSQTGVADADRPSAPRTRCRGNRSSGRNGHHWARRDPDVSAGGLDDCSFLAAVIFGPTEMLIVGGGHTEGIQIGALNR